MQGSRLIAVMLTSATLAGCAEQGGPLTREGVGTAAGAVAGGVLGSTIGSGTGKTVAVVGGALLGGVLGNVIGKSMDNTDRTAYDRASQRALETGQSQSWKNPQSGHYGTITPSRRYTDETGRPCREYTQTIYVEGQKHTAHGIACRMADGEWEIVNG